MRLLWEVEGQDERVRSRVLDFHTTTSECGLGDKPNLGINLAQLHILVILHFELANSPASTIRVEQCRTLRAKIRLTARLYRESEN